MKKKYIILQNSIIFFLTLALLCLQQAFAQNPPHAKVAGTPTLQGSNYEFTISLEPFSGGNANTDCGAFDKDCNLTGEGIENLQIKWFLFAMQNCSNCPLDSTLITSGSVEHGFWGTNCIQNSTTTGTNCTNPGGCNSILPIPAANLCSGTQYQLLLYAFNPNYNKGVAENSNVGPGPYRCCGGDPALGNYQNMLPCLLSNGGSGWLNPSAPYFYTFTYTEQQPVPPTLTITTSNAQNGTTLNCGDDFTTTFEISPNNTCAEGKLRYKILLNGTTLLDQTTTNCIGLNEIQNVNFTTELITCALNPNCSLLPTQSKALCGTNTLRWEVMQACSNAAVAFEERTFTVQCSNADTLTLANNADAFLCPNESATVEVKNNDNIVIPYTTGSYHIFWNNASPYANPNLNHLGATNSVAITNNGVFPYNTPINFVGTIWENYPTSAPTGCEAISGSTTVVMLTPIAVQNQTLNCAFNTIQVQATGGFPQYDNTASYTYSIPELNISNTTGSFSNILEGTYTVNVNDSKNCTATLQVTVYDSLKITATPSCTPNTVNITAASGGTPPYTIFLSTTPTLAGLGSVPSSPSTLSSTGSFGNVVVGNYYAIIKDANNCFSAIPISVAAAPTLKQLSTTCESGSLGVEALLGKAGFSFYLYQNNGTFDVNNPENAGNGWFQTEIASSDADRTVLFQNVSAGTYKVFAIDGNGCAVAGVTVQVSAQNLTIENISEVCDIGKISMQAQGGSTPYLYSLLTQNQQVITTNSTGVFNSLPTGTYIAQVTDAVGCTNTQSVVTNAQTLDIQTPYVCAQGFNAIGGNGSPYTYELYTTATPPLFLETSATGIFSTNLNSGTYILKIYDKEGCTVEKTVTCTPPPCDLQLSKTETCISSSQYSVTLNVSGTGTYTINDGIHPIINNATAGAFNLGNFNSNTAYSVTVTDKNNAACSASLSGSKNCFTCDLTASIQTNCISGTQYSATLTFSGTGTYTINDGVHAPITNATAGTINLGNFNNGNYTVTITSNIDSNCKQTLSGSKNCANCDLSASVQENCLNANQYGLILTISGSSTYTITDGVHTPITNATAGTINLGTFSNGGYSIVITDNNNAVCTQTVSGSKNCANCDLNASVQENCLNANQYGLNLTISGSSTYTVTDGVHTPITNATAGTINLGTFSNGGYSIVITDNNNAVCTQTVSGSKNCANCDLSASVQENCLNTNQYSLNLTISGSSTYTITDGVHTPITNATAGTINLGTFSNGAYSIVITDNNNAVCTQTISGSKNCADCDLNATFLPSCINSTVYAGFLTLSGSSTYTINDGVHTPITNATVGTINLGNFTNSNYTITIIDNENPNCTKIVSGTKNCFTCDLIATAVPTCVNSATYSIDLTISGTGTYTINDGVHTPITNATAGTINLGTFSNGNYNITVTSNIDNTCNQVLTGSKTCFDCNIAATVTPVCATANIYILLMSLIGEGTFTIDDGVHPPITDAVASPTINLGQITTPNYTVTITSNLDPSCKKIITGSKDCSLCTLNASSEVTCINNTQYSVTINLQGEGTYKITDGVHPTLFAATAGSYTLSPFNSNSAYNITVQSNINPACSTKIVGSKTCFTCQLPTESVVKCKDGGKYDVVFSVNGSGTFTVSDNALPNSTLVNATAGNLTFGTYNNNQNYNITIKSNIDTTCQSILTGNGSACATPPPCDAVVVATPICINNNGYDIKIMLAGNNTYNIISPNNSPITNISAGTYTIQGFENGDYNFTVLQNNNAQCSKTISGTYNCAAPLVCDLLASTTTTCLTPNTFETTLTLSGTGTYKIADGVHAPLLNKTAGDIPLGIFNNGNYTVTVTDQNNPTCTLAVPFAKDCSQQFPCNAIVTATPTCLNNNAYSIDLSIEGNGTFTIFDGGIHPTLQNISAGTLNLGIFTNPNYNILVTPNQQNVGDDCSYTLTGTQSCNTPEPCNVAVIAQQECINFFKDYNLHINLMGEGIFELNDGVHPVSQHSAGTNFTVGSYPQNTSPILVFTNIADTSCHTTFTATGGCASSCDLTLTLDSIGKCIGGKSPVTFTIAGNGLYEVITNLSGLQGVTELSAGTYTYWCELAETGNILALKDNDVQFQAFAECYAVIEFNNNCPKPTCDLNATPELICFSDSTIAYSMNINIAGSSTYSVTVNNGDFGVGVGGDVLNFGVYENTEYTISIADQADSTCTMYLSGSNSCLPPYPPCDLNVNLDAVCVSDSSYVATLNIQGGGIYGVYKGLYIEYPDNTEAIENNVPNNTSVSVEIPNGSYKLFVIDENNKFCYADFIGGRDCTQPQNCNFYFNVQSTCNPNYSFNLEAVLEGVGTYHITVYNQVGGTVLKDLTGQVTGTIDLGTILFGNSYYIYVESEQDNTCAKDVFGYKLCEPQEPKPCDLQINPTLNCISNSSSSGVIEITGTSTYEITVNETIIKQNAAQGSYTLPTLSATDPNENITYNITVKDNDQPATCFKNATVTKNCENTFPCDLIVSAVTPCNGANYSVYITIKGSGMYNITTSEQGTILGVPAGDYLVIENLHMANNYEVLITDANNENCSFTLQGWVNCVPGSNNPGDSCNLNISAVPLCLNSDTYQLNLTINGPANTYDVNFNGQNTTLAPGTHVLQPFNNGAYSITVAKPNSFVCKKTVQGTKNCNVQPTCNLQASPATDCLSDTTFAGNCIIAGTSLYNITLSNGDAFTDQSAGNIPLGIFYTHQQTTVTVTDKFNPNCKRTFVLQKNCDPVTFPCDLSLEAVPQCTTNGEPQVVLTINGNSTYTIDYGLDQLPLSNQPQGTYLLTGFNPDSTFTIFVQDEQKNDCMQSISGNFTCDTVITHPCNLEIVPQDPVCIDNEHFIVPLLIFGNDTYLITDGTNQNPIQTTAGNINSNPFPNGNYFLEVSAQNNPACKLNVSGTFECITPTGSLSGLAFYDFNSNGLQNTGDVGIPNLVVGIYTSDGTLVDTAHTNALGYYVFTNLIPDIYFITIQTPTDYLPTLQNVGDNNLIDSDINAQGNSDVFQIVAGQNTANLDGGFYQQGCFGINVAFNVLCGENENAGSYFAQINIEGGQAPYFVYNQNNTLIQTIQANQLPLIQSQAIQAGTPLYIQLQDANGCIGGIYTEAAPCLNLDIELLNFSGEVQPQANLLQWVSATEINNAFYTLQHSLNQATNFENVTTLKGAGNTTKATQYQFLDLKNIESGIHYYRLQQTNFDGSTKNVGNIIALNRTNNDFAINNVSPIPAQKQVQIQFNSPQSTTTTLTIYNVLGKKISTQNLPTQKGLNTQYVNIESYSAGTYYIVLQQNEQIISTQIIKQ